MHRTSSWDRVCPGHTAQTLHKRTPSSVIVEMLKEFFTHVLPGIALQLGLRTFAEVAEGAGATAPAAEGRPEACHNLTKAGVWPSLRACCSWYRGVGKVEEKRLPYAAGLSSFIPMIGAEHARGQCTCLFPPDGASIGLRL